MMYYALKTSDIEFMSHEHQEYILASSDELAVLTLEEDINKLAPEIECSIEQIDSDSTTLLHICNHDWNYSTTREEYLGESALRLEILLNKELKKYPENNCYLSEVKFVDALDDNLRFELLRKFTSSDPEKHLKGIDRKLAAKKSGEYFENPSKFNTFEGITIHTQCDKLSPHIANN